MASLGFLTLFVSIVLMVVPIPRRLALRYLVDHTGVITAPKRAIEWH